MPPRDIYLGTEVRLQEDSDGSVWTPHTAALYERWRPYVDGLGRVTLVGRLRKGVSDPAGRADGNDVEVLGLPHYLGLKEMIRTLPSVVQKVARIGSRHDVFIGRLPEPLSLLLHARARLLRAPFISLVVADPQQLIESMRPGWQGRLGGKLLAAVTRHCVRHSKGTVYVTQEWLQRLYPPVPGRPTLARSNVALDENSFVPEPKQLSRDVPFRLITVGTLGSPAKGTDVLLEVMADLITAGRTVQLDVVGGGLHLEELRKRSEHLGIAQAVTFHGHVSDAAKIRRLLDQASVYVSASRVEGLPRATVEALARALPVVSTDAGGVRELVQSDLVLPIDDRRGLASAIERLLSDENAYAAASALNLETARATRESAREEHLTRFLRDNFRTP